MMSQTGEVYVVTKKTPQEWCTQVGLVIVDPDGWRTPKAPPIDEPVDWIEFAHRIKLCTVRLLPSFVGWSNINPDVEP